MLCLKLNLALFLGLQLYGQDEREQRVEREAYSTIQSQLLQAGATHEGPLLSNAQTLARNLESALPDGRIIETGQFKRSADWKQVAVVARFSRDSRPYLIQIKVAPGVDAAAKDMAVYFSRVQAAFRPGTKSGVSIGQARYFYGCDAVVFLRLNVMIKLGPELPGPPDRRPRSCVEDTKETEGLALKVDREIQDIAFHR